MVSRYNWTISSGPGRTDPNCITFAYYSSADFVKVQHTLTNTARPLFVMKAMPDFKECILSIKRKILHVDVCLIFVVSGESGQDLASGLVGPLVVCRKGTLDKDRRRTDVDKEFALLFMVFDENESWYLDKNIETYLQENPEIFNKDEEGFIESNMMHG